MTQEKLSIYGNIILRGTWDNWQLSGFILTSVLKSIEFFIRRGLFIYFFNLLLSSPERDHYLASPRTHYFK